MKSSTDTPQNAIDLATLYDRDFYLWIETTSKLLRDGKFHELDIDNLAEEIETMGRSEKHALTSNLRVLLMHLLKYKYQPQKRTNSWKYTIREHRKRLQKLLKDSPSLYRYFIEMFDESYQDARELAADETGMSIDRFPETSPFSQEETLDSDYLPTNDTM